MNDSSVSCYGRERLWIAVLRLPEECPFHSHAMETPTHTHLAFILTPPPGEQRDHWTRTGLTPRVTRIHIKHPPKILQTRPDTPAPDAP